MSGEFIKHLEEEMRKTQQERIDNENRAMLNDGAKCMKELPPFPRPPNMDEVRRQYLSGNSISHPLLVWENWKERLAQYEFTLLQNIRNDRMGGGL